VNSFSNGTRLMKHLDIVRKLNLLYVSYDRVRAKQYPEISDRVLRDARHIRETLRTPIVIVATVTPEDSYEDFTPLLRYIEELGMKLVLQPVRVGWCVNDFSWFNEILKNTVADFGGKMLFNTRSSYSRDDIRRCRPKLVLYINSDGTVAYPCERFMSQTSGNLLTDDARMLWRRGLELHGEYPNERCENCGMTCWWDGMDNFKAPWRLDFLRF